MAIRLSNTPSDTLIGKRVVTVSSTIYGSPEYIERLRKDGGVPQWLGVECCGFHKSWTKQACGDQPHRFYVDDTLLTQAALREGTGVSILLCFMGDSDPALVLVFRDHMMETIKARADLFASRHTH